MQRPTDTDLRQNRNRLAVAAATPFGRHTTRVELARHTGLSTTTISSVTSELIADGLFVEPEKNVRPTGASGGRPARALALNPALGNVIGIHLGHASVHILLAGLDGTIRAEHTHTTDVDHQPADTLEYVASTALDLVADLDITHRQLLDVGVAVSAPVLLSSGTLSSPPMLSDWGEVDIAALLSKRMGLPVHIGNDANLGALAEWQLGAGASVDNLIYVMLSEGVGSGLILHGRLYEGATGTSGELGHATVIPGGQICRCGNRGCLETIVGARALMTALAHTHGPTTFADLIRLAERNDPGVQRLLSDTGRAVGAALAPVCTVLDPELVVIGGTLAQTGEPLLGGIRNALTDALPPVIGRAQGIVLGRLGARAETFGAAALAGEAAVRRLVAGSAAHRVV